MVISLQDTDAEGWVKKLAALGGMPGVKTRQLQSPTVSSRGVAEAVSESVEENNHWYDAGVKDAQRDAKLYPDRVVKKLNPRTYLPTLKDKQAQHPEEVEQYSQGYRSVKPGVAEGHGAMDLATMDKISHSVKAWNNADRNVEQLITQGHTIKFYPDKIEIFKGGELIYSKDGNFSNVTNGLVVRAKNLVSNLIYKSKQGVAEARMSAAQRLWNAEQKQRAKSDASLARTPSSIPKPEPKKDEKIAEKLKTGPAAHFTPKDAHVKRGQFVGGDAGESVEEKIKGADGKACWDGYRYNGTENGSDKCVKVSEDVKNKMASLITLLENK